jgi:hypothetical protein
VGARGPPRLRRRGAVDPALPATRRAGRGRDRDAESEPDRDAHGVGTSNAQAAPYESVPTTASGYSNLAYQCSEASQVYTVTISGPSGVTHHSVTIERG